MSTYLDDKPLLEKLRGYTDQQLVDYFNAGVGKKNWMPGRSYFLGAIANEFQNRLIDYSVGLNASGKYEIPVDDAFCLVGNKLLLQNSKPLYDSYSQEVKLINSNGNAVHHAAITVNYLESKETSIRVLNLLRGTQERLLLALNHNYQQTLLDFTHVPEYLVLNFDTDKKFTGITLNSSKIASPFIQLSQSRYLIFIPCLEFELNNIDSFILSLVSDDLKHKEGISD